MKKSLSTIVLMSALTVAAPMMHASEPMGTNPRPYIHGSTIATIAYTVLAYIVR